MPSDPGPVGAIPSRSRRAAMRAGRIGPATGPGVDRAACGGFGWPGCADERSVRPGVARPRTPSTTGYGKRSARTSVSGHSNEADCSWFSDRGCAGSSGPATPGSICGRRATGSTTLAHRAGQTVPAMSSGRRGCRVRRQSPPPGAGCRPRNCRSPGWSPRGYPTGRSASGCTCRVAPSAATCTGSSRN